MSSRVTRSAARRAAEQTHPSSAAISPRPQPSSAPHSSSPSPLATESLRSRRKRKASPPTAVAPQYQPRDAPAAGSSSSDPRPKRRKLARRPSTSRDAETTSKMSNQNAPVSRPATSKDPQPAMKKSTRSRKEEQKDFPGQQSQFTSAIAQGPESQIVRQPHDHAGDNHSKQEGGNEPSGENSPTSGTKSDIHQRVVHEQPDGGGGDGEDDDDDDDDNDDNDDDAEDMDDDLDDEESPEHARNHFLSRFGGPGGFPAMRALGGLMGGLGSTSRFREMLSQLRSEDPSIQMIALQELSNFLLISTEDNLTGHFVPDQFVRELVKLMQPNEITGEENPEMMLLACRCVANLMEALPPATASVVYGGAVPVLCQKLLEIHYIDVAEQALSTLEKISVDFPASIVREGGLGACLNYLDFFATGTQRTAVTTAANCCRNIPEDSFPAVRDVMSVLQTSLSSSDQKVVEQGSLCVSRIVESFKHKHGNLEKLVSDDLLRAILRLLAPGTTNLIPTDIHTKFVRVLAIVAKASASRAATLLQMDVVDTLYQILTGVSPPGDMEDIASNIDGVVIMQSLIRKQRDQIYETLNVICEMLPGLTPNDTSNNLALSTSFNGIESIARADLQANDGDVDRRERLNASKGKLERFASILLPTLTHAYTSTVNLGVRQKVLAAQLKMLSNLDIPILESALRTVPFASHLASILSQQDHPILVLLALAAAQLLSTRLGAIYNHQFCREGVLAEITKLSRRSLHEAQRDAKESEENREIRSDLAIPLAEPSAPRTENDGHDDSLELAVAPEEDEEEEGDETDDEHDEEDDTGHDHVIHEEMSPSPSESSSSEPTARKEPSTIHLEGLITVEARLFVENFAKTSHSQARDEALAVLEDVRSLASDIQDCYTNDEFSEGVQNFQKLARYFGGHALQSITSAELLGSNLVDVLLETFGSTDEAGLASKTAFMSVFMNEKAQGTYSVTGVPGMSVPFTALVQKLQDLLSRAEHFGVVTVQSNSQDNSRNGAASMLAKQLRLKLVADEDSDVPRSYRNIMVSIHAIATFKALDDYLRPRLSFTERGPRGGRHAQELLSGIPASRHSQEMLSAIAGMPPEYRQRLRDSGLLLDPPALASPPTQNPESDWNLHQKTTRQSRQPGEVTAAPSTPPIASTNPKTRVSRADRRRHESSLGGVETDSASNDVLDCADKNQVTEGEDGEGRDGTSPSGPTVRPVGATGVAASEARIATPDPGAVNMEVASTGKVTARQDDGTRIPTPSQRGAVAPPTATLETPNRSRIRQTAVETGSTVQQRAISYAAAIQSTPQDWHIEFSINGQPISNETTIYRAVHYQQHQPDDRAPKSPWSAVHPISFRRVPGPPPEPSSLSPSSGVDGDSMSRALSSSLDKNPLASKILRLLAILHEMGTDLEGVLGDRGTHFQARADPSSSFVNTKLTAKLNRQLEEPLIVASNCLPGWSEDLARLYPFLFPFETRHLFLQSTSFGYSRSMTRWQGTQTEQTRRDRHRDERPFLGRLQRQKVRISRARILESAMKVMELYGASPSMLEVEYFEEVGTGLGPTLEFYSNVSKEFSKRKLKLWRENDIGSANDNEYAFGQHGLFPAPVAPERLENDNGRRILHLFRMMGKFVARAMLDSRIIDISFHPMFFKFNDGQRGNLSGLAAIKSLDSGLYSSLKMLEIYVTQKKRIEDDSRLSVTQKAAKLERIVVQGATVSDLGFDFTLPGYPQIELIEDGSNIPVSISNVEEYLDKIIDYTVHRGVQKQIHSFRAGFSEVFPYSALKAFTPAELVMLFGRVKEDWSMETLVDSIKADHGYNMESASVRNLLHSMSELDGPQRRDFLQFITGSPKLPIGGFKSLTPMFTVVCKPSEPPLTSDDYLPSVMTCVNYLKLPDYSNIQVMKSRLFTAIREGQGAFHLS